MRKIITLCLLCCIASGSYAQLWTEQMYGQYTYKNYTSYAAFNRAIDQTDFDASLMEAALFYETNRQRDLHGLAQFAFDYNLCVCAHNHSYDMVTSNFFSHVSPVAGKATMSDRLAQVGYTNCAAAENIAYCPFKPSYAETARYLVADRWMNSQGHRANILNSDYTHLGCGAAFYRDGSFYYVKATQNFLHKAPDKATLSSQSAKPSKAWTDKEIQAANTARSCSYMTQLERDVMLYINLARLFPKRFAEIEVRNYQHAEGFGVFPTFPQYKQSLLDDLNAMTPVQALQPDKEYYDFARCWAEESGSQGLRGHNRVKCAGFPYGGECCSYGVYTAIDITLQWLIDDQVPSLGHRKNCLDPEFSKAGISHALHTDAGHCTVLDLK